MTAIAVRRSALVVAAAGTLALVACSSGSSGTSASSTGSSTSTSTTSTTTSAPTVSATGTPSISVDSARLSAIATCLKDAGLPTPTSTDAADGAAELLRLARDPRTVAALRACGIPLPGGEGGASGSVSVTTS